MSDHNFNTPSRQSAKGIIVIFGVSVYKVLKGTIIVFAAFFIKTLQSDKSIDISNPKLILSVVGFILFFLIFATLKYLNFKFYVDKEYFILKQGIINKEETSVAKSKIQNVYIKQNVIQQIINVVSLSIETAGDNKTEIEIKALSKAKAEDLKTLLLSGQVSEVYKAETLEVLPSIYYKASFKKIFLEGISENHLKSLILVLAFIIGLYNDFKDIVKQFEITSRFNKYFELDEKALLGLVVLNITLLIVLIVIAFILSLVRTVIKNFNLTVFRTKDGLEISKGLLNKINLSLVSTRIQNTTISTNRLKKALGLYKLSFTQAMLNKKQQLNFNIIGLNKKQITELVNQFYPNVFSNLKKYKPHRYFIRREIVANFFLFIIFNILLYFAPRPFLFINIPLLILLIFNVIYAYKKAYYSIDDQFIVAGSGKLIDTTTTFLEIHKVQGISLNQTFFQRRRAIASIKIHSASKSVSIPHIEIATARTIVNYLLFKVESQDKDWM